jgi:hypothetical protein
LTSAFDKIAKLQAQKILQANAFFGQANAFFLQEAHEAQIRARCALTSAFDKIAGTKKNCRQTLFLQHRPGNWLICRAKRYARARKWVC